MKHLFVQLCLPLASYQVHQRQPDAQQREVVVVFAALVLHPRVLLLYAQILTQPNDELMLVVSIAGAAAEGEG